MAQPAPFDAKELKRRMHGAVDALKHDFGGLRTGRASANLLDPIQSPETTTSSMSLLYKSRIARLISEASS